jgi:hypothetical protein
MTRTLEILSCDSFKIEFVNNGKCEECEASKRQRTTATWHMANPKIGGWWMVDCEFATGDQEAEESGKLQ